MAQFNLQINGVVMNVVDSLGQSQPLSAAHVPAVPVQGIPAELFAGSQSASDFKYTDPLTFAADSNRA
jgi:hypothetical protein